MHLIHVLSGLLTYPIIFTCMYLLLHVFNLCWLYFILFNTTVFLKKCDDIFSLRGLAILGRVTSSMCPGFSWRGVAILGRVTSSMCPGFSWRGVAILGRVTSSMCPGFSWRGVAILGRVTSSMCPGFSWRGVAILGRVGLVQRVLRRWRPDAQSDVWRAAVRWRPLSRQAGALACL